MIAVLVVRDGVLPAGAGECVAEAGGRAVLVGSGVADAAALDVPATDVSAAEAGAFAPGAWAEALAPHLAHEDVVVLPASPDGRDLAPRLAQALDRPLLAGAVRVTPNEVELVRGGGLVAEIHELHHPFVATLEPGSRGAEPGKVEGEVRRLDLALPAGAADATVVEVLPPDPATVDLSEARRIVAGGAGLGGEAAFALLRRVAPALGAAYGASRVVADAGLVPQDRFIGTTGVAVDPDLYIALGISGAVQHVSGLGDPDHVIAVNLDRSCPMMSMADLAIVADAPAVLAALARRLGVDADG